MNDTSCRVPPFTLMLVPQLMSVGSFMTRVPFGVDRRVG
jgi:hypothetical protein